MITFPLACRIRLALGHVKLKYHQIKEVQTGFRALKSLKVNSTLSVVCPVPLIALPGPGYPLSIVLLFLRPEFPFLLMKRQ
jgi:hypothetical protein